MLRQQSLRKLGEDMTRTLEVVPRQWKVIETGREKFSCRDCEKIRPAQVCANDGFSQNYSA